MSRLFSYDYLGPEVLRGYDAYKYSCQDTSPLSNYVMHPFWNQVVKLCPSWVAPNLLTFVGFLCCVGHFGVGVVFDYDYTASTLDSASPIPGWAWILTSVLLFLSHTLDGIDGKQARRTGTSSPLGELFDHGCDSWSTIFITGTFYSVFGRNLDGYSISEFRMYLILWSVFFVFHVSHWEKYNTGVMFLPWSYDVAMVGGTVLYFVTGLGGYQMWKVKLPGGSSAGPLLEGILYFFCYVVSFPVALNNIRKSYKERTGKMRPVLEAIRPMISYTLCFVVCVLWAACSKNAILERDVRAFFYLSGTLYANMSCRLIVAQMSNSRCEAVNYLIYPLVAVVAVSLLAPVGAAVELALLYALTALTTMVHLHYVTCVVRQMCEYLKIDCFRIKNMGEQRLLSDQEAKDALADALEDDSDDDA